MTAHLTLMRQPSYHFTVAVNPVAGLESPKWSGDQPHSTCLAAFLSPCQPIYGRSGRGAARLAECSIRSFDPSGTVHPFESGRAVPPPHRMEPHMPAKQPYFDARSERAVTRAINVLERSFKRGADPSFNSSELARHYFQCKLGRIRREEFHACWLDAQHRLIATEVLFVGTLTHTTVYPREIVKSALAHSAAAVILAHNHPGGHPEPSDADLRLTKVLRETLALIEVRLLDHIIVAVSGSVSLSQRGLVA